MCLTKKILSKLMIDIKNMMEEKEKTNILSLELNEFPGSSC